MIIEQIRTAFLEDVAVFEAQQRNLQMIPNPPQTDINADCRRDPGAPHPRSAASGGAGGGGEDGGGGIRPRS